MSIKSQIISKALILIGAYGSGAINNIGTKASKSEMLAEEFVISAIEETMLSILWPFALKQIFADRVDSQGVDSKNGDGDGDEFISVTERNANTPIEDAIKIAIIVPSNLEWYISSGRIYIKGNKFKRIFYYSSDILEKIIIGDRNLSRIVPSGFVTLAAFSLSSQIAFALYSDSVFADGMRRQYLLKLESMRQNYSIDYNLVNSGVV